MYAGRFVAGIGIAIHPLRIHPSRGGTVASAGGQKNQNKRMGKARVLVVDDDPGMRDLLRHLLCHRGYEVEAAEDGVQALAHLEDESYDVVVTDYQMPHLDGLGLLREIQQMEHPIPVIVHSSAVDERTGTLFRRAGAFRLVTKGGPLEDLVQSVDEAIGRHSPARCA
jgi:CheY-like chemotaxis protein